MWNSLWNLSLPKQSHKTGSVYLWLLTARILSFEGPSAPCTFVLMAQSPAPRSLETHLSIFYESRILLVTPCQAVREWREDEWTVACVSRDLWILLEKEEMKVCQASILLSEPFLKRKMSSSPCLSDKVIWFEAHKIWNWAHLPRWPYLKKKKKRKLHEIRASSQALRPKQRARGKVVN